MTEGEGVPVTRMIIDPAPGAEILRLDRVSLRYGGAEASLQEVSLTLTAGSFHFVTGASGAGKTSLLNLICMAARPSSGTLTLFGQNVASLRPDDKLQMRRRIGAVFQDFGLLDHLSTFENAALPLRVTGRKLTSYRSDIHDLLRWVGLGNRMHTLPPRLSGGEKQRLAIARAIVGRPDILVADEPTGHVDREMGVRILKLFAELNRQGTTVVIATHDQDLVARAGKPVLHLGGGQLVQAPETGS